MYQKLASIEDFDHYFLLKCDDANVYWTGHKSAPSKEKLFSWFSKNIKNENRLFFLFFRDEKYIDVVGYLYMDLLDSGKEIDVGYGVHSGYSGMGYGTGINKFALEYAKKNIKQATQLQAWIASDNMGSVKCVTKNGYYVTDDAKEVVFGNGEKKKFIKYLFALSSIA